MTSRERVLAAIAHREPDRVPIDQGAHRSSGIMGIAYNRLKRRLGVETAPPCMHDLIQQIVIPEPWYLDRFHADAVDLGRAFPPEGGWRPWTLPDGSEACVPAWFRPERENGALVVRDETGTVIGRMPGGFVCFDQAYWPLKAPGGLDSFEPLEEHMTRVIWGSLRTGPFDRPLTAGRLAEVRRAAEQFRRETARAIVLPVGCNLLEWSQFLFGMEDVYLYLGSEKRKMHAFLDRLTEVHLDFLERAMPAVRGSVDILVVGDDLGSQRGPQISRAMYREFFLPRHKCIYGRAKELSNAHIMLHSCGGIYPLIPDLIEAGVEILNPVQTGARNMEPERLKREFGRDLTFWGGGCDTQGVLVSGTPVQVRDDVRRRLEVFMPGGGFVWNQIHNILADVPPENIVAMLEAAYEFGRY